MLRVASVLSRHVTVNLTRRWLSRDRAYRLMVVSPGHWYNYQFFGVVRLTSCPALLTFAITGCIKSESPKQYPSLLLAVKVVPSGFSVCQSHADGFCAA